MRLQVVFYIVSEELMLFFKLYVGSDQQIAHTSDKRKAEEFAMYEFSLSRNSYSRSYTDGNFEE